MFDTLFELFKQNIKKINNKKLIQATIQKVATEYAFFFLFSFNILKYSLSIVNTLTLPRQLSNKRISHKENLIDSFTGKLIS